MVSANGGVDQSSDWRVISHSLAHDITLYLQSISFAASPPTTSSCVRPLRRTHTQSVVRNFPTRIRPSPYSTPNTQRSNRPDDSARSHRFVDSRKYQKRRPSHRIFATDDGPTVKETHQCGTRRPHKYTMFIAACALFLRMLKPAT